MDNARTLVDGELVAVATPAPAAYMPSVSR